MIMRDLKLPMRAAIGINNADLDEMTIQQFAETITPDKVLKYRNVGQKTVMDIKKALRNQGISWAPDFPVRPKSTRDVLKERLSMLRVKMSYLDKELKQTEAALKAL